VLNDNDDDGGHHPLFDRLAALTRLDELVLWNDGRDSVLQYGGFEERAYKDQKFKLMKVSLEKGLGRLCTLMNLREFRLDFMNPGTFSALEARWMVQHWPGLDRVHICNVLDAIQEEIQEVFDASSVRCIFEEW